MAARHTSGSVWSAATVPASYSCRPTASALTTFWLASHQKPSVRCCESHCQGGQGIASSSRTMMITAMTTPPLRRVSSGYYGNGNQLEMHTSQARQKRRYHALLRPLYAESTLLQTSRSTIRSSLRPPTRQYHDYLRVHTAGGQSARVPLRSGKNGVFGVVSSRGNRGHQEDTYSAACVHIDPVELRYSLQSSRSRVLQEAGKRWDPLYQGEDDAIAGQVVWFGCFDGHGGQAVSTFLKDELHEAFETVEPNMITDTVRFTRKIGGYFRRFAGGVLERWVRQDLLPQIRPSRPGSAHHRPPTGEQTQPAEEGPSKPLSTEEIEASARKERKRKQRAEEAVIMSDSPTGVIDVERIEPTEEMKKEAMTIGERATLSWLHMDRRIQSSKVLNVGGSTSSVALLHSLDTPAQPWYSSQVLSVTSIQIGDTRMLLCSVSDGHAIPLTNYHHPDDRSEAERLRRVGAGLVTDSFGEARWMGALANTRAFGDSHFKKAGVTAEPEVITQVLRGDDFAFILAFSDGIGGVVSDQEAVDLCRNAQHPQDAAQSVVRYAEALGSEDNATCMVIPLRGWGKVQGRDKTAENRKFKLSKVDIFRDNRQ